MNHLKSFLERHGITMAPADLDHSVYVLFTRDSYFGWHVSTEELTQMSDSAVLREFIRRREVKLFITGDGTGEPQGLKETGRMSERNPSEQRISKPITMRTAGRILRETIQQQEQRAQDPKLLYPNDNQGEEKDMSEFTAVQVYLDETDINELRSDGTPGKKFTDRMIRTLVEALPPLVDLREGMRYIYDSGHKYEIVRLGDTEAVLRRLTRSSAGEVGSQLTESIDKIRHDLLTERALLQVDEDGE